MFIQKGFVYAAAHYWRHVCSRARSRKAGCSLMMIRMNLLLLLHSFRPPLCIGLMDRFTASRPISHT